jgi:hypothetical protein
MTTQVWVTVSNGTLHFDFQQGDRLATVQEFETHVPCEPGSLWFDFQEGEQVQFSDGLFLVDYDRDEGLCPVFRRLS